MDSKNPDSSWNIAGLVSRNRIALLACLVALLSYAAARLGGTLEILPEAEWPFWPANVLVVSVMLLVPRRIWPLLLAAALSSFALYNLQKGVTVDSILWLAVADTVEILTAAFALSYFFDNLPQLNGVKALAKYSFFAGILAPFTGATFGALAAKSNYWTNWRISFLSEAIAYFTVMPAVLGWIARVRSGLHHARAQYLEATVLFAAIISISGFVFVSRWSSTLPALPFLLVPFLLWSALRFGSAGAGTAASIVAFMSVLGAAHGRGPFTGTAAINNVLWLQLFLLSTAVPFMVLAALVEGHDQDEKVLRESERRFRLVADTAPVLIWMSGTDKKHNFVNKGWLDFTGRSMTDELGDGWVSDVHLDDAQRCLETYTASFDARVDFEMEYRLRRSDGEYRWIVDYGVPRFDSDGIFCGFVGSCVDITERKSSEKSLQARTGRLSHSQEEERARIATGLHDDFSQRLALISIGLGQLWKILPESDVEERARVHEILKETGELSSDLHALSHQLHSSKLEHVGLASAIAGLCKEITLKYRIAAHFTACDLHRDIPKDLALCLFRVTQEALGNVVKHSRASSAYVELGANETGLSLRIRDDGTGFDATTVNPNAGIGLIGMHERIRLVGGRLGVTSELMRGTEILVEVPFHSSPDEVKAKVQTAGR